MRKGLIYKHTLLISEKKGGSYIGQTCTTTKHRGRNGFGYTHKASAFGKVVKEFGWENFSHEIIEVDINSKELADERERFGIFYYHTYLGDPECRGFNSTKGGSSGGTINKIKIYKPNTDEKIFIDKNDLADFENLGGKQWYTKDRKSIERHKYYITHKDYELELNKKNRKRHQKQKTVKYDLSNIKREDFKTEEEYKSAYNKEYGRLYRQDNKEKLKLYFHNYQKEHREEVNRNKRKSYHKLKNRN